MKLDKNMNILIVGLGLMGGSYAMALTKKGYRVNAVTRSKRSVDLAKKNGLINEGATEPDKRLVGEADLVIFALYPHVFTEWVEKYQGLFKSGAVITDVTGVKCGVVEKIQNVLREDVEFIAAHPMAGREVCGVENSTDAIFEGANYVVTPTEKNTPEAIELCEDLGRELGFARISRLSPKDHDTIIAFVSQLTHCIAVSLMCCQTHDRLQDYTGDSFRDLTRIARINDEMWSELFLANKKPLLEQIELFEGELDRLKGYLRSGDRDALRDMMKYSTMRRALFDKKKDS